MSKGSINIRTPSSIKRSTLHHIGKVNPPPPSSMSAPVTRGAKIPAILLMPDAIPYAVARTFVGNASGVKEYNTPHMMLEKNDAEILQMSSNRGTNNDSEEAFGSSDRGAAALDTTTKASREISVAAVLTTMVPLRPRRVSTAYMAATEPGTPAKDIIT